jgi:hypothetical protein
MVVYSKQSYDDQDYGCILSAVRKQQYIMFPAPISFLKDELKAELGKKMKKDEEEEDTKLCSLKVPMDRADKESKQYLVKMKKYDLGTPEVLLKRWMPLNEQMENHVYCGNYEMMMNLVQAMLEGHGLEDLLIERCAQ